MTVKVTDNLSIDVRPTSNKKYDIITIRGNRETILFSSDKPITSYSKQNSGKKVIQYLEKKLKLYEVEKIMEEQQVPRGIALEEFKDEYIQNILSELERIRGLRCGNFKEQLEVANDEAIAIEEVEQLIMMGRKYPPLFQHFQSRCTEFNFTPLEFIAKVTEGLGVGLTIEVLRAFFGFLQTYLGYKGTNVIAVGSQASGKSHILETALKFIPQERVHYGVKSVAYFFRKYNHMDLTGHIFMLGDLGGDHDGEDTIRMRDLLKQLTTDGYVERGIVDNQNDNVAEEQWVKGYPCLAYTTAHEEIINEQEKSRSIIITPPFIDGHDLMTFKAIMNNQGSYKYELEKVDKDCKSIQGFVHYMSMTKNDVDIFNVYLYDIVDYIGNIDDFNRKIDEFNSILKLSCILNKARTIYHTQYDGLEYPLILVGKQDIRTALTIFDNNNNLLPNEVKLVNGIFKNFKPYDVGKCKSNTAYEDAVKFEVGTLEGSNDADWLSCNTDTDGQYFFTERYLKTECGRQRWYRNNHENMSFKLQKLYDQNYLIQVGTDNNNPVYGVNGFLYDGSPVNRIEPSFNEKNLCQGKELFEQNYTDCVGEMEDFIKSNKGINKNSELFFEKLLKEEHIYKLGWLK